MKLDNTTVRGVILIVAAISIAVRPDKITDVVSAAFALVGMINVIRDPNPKPPTQ